MPPRLLIACLIATVTVFHSSAALAWHDETHLAVARAARYQKWYNAAAADIAKEKGGAREQHNHYCNLPNDATVTPALVLQQVPRYNDGSDSTGHLYGAIVAAVSEYRKARAAEPGKYAEYHLAYAAHYLGDLSQPLHNVPYDEFNMKWHRYDDGIVEAEALENVEEIRKRMYDIVLDPADLENDLAREVARIANDSRKLARELVHDKRALKREEAYRQLAHSASLLKALLYALTFPPQER